MADSAISTTVMTEQAPVLSFPAILRNPGLNSRFAHLQAGSREEAQNRRSQTVSASLKKQRRDENDGKRWIRRKDNAHFVGNPHIVAATKRDYGIALPQVRTTFPEPLPSYLPRTVKLPTVAELPPTNPLSANAGRFSLSLKGMRRELRRQGGRAEALVQAIEGEMQNWLLCGGTVLAPDRDVIGPNAPAVGDGIPIGNIESIVEVSRTPLQLIWRIPDDSFARYVVHCCARYHEIVSFSKGESTDRLTYLLRPNVTRPDHLAPACLDTPPATDFDYSSNPDVDTESNIESDFVSDRDLESDVEPSDNLLMTIKEIASPIPSSPQLSPGGDTDTWSLVGDTDADVESSNELDIEARIENLSLSPPSAPPLFEAPEDPDRTITSPIRPLHRPHPLNASRRVIRSASSPSRSPVRVRPAHRRRALGPALPLRNAMGTKRSFYEFIFQ